MDNDFELGSNLIFKKGGTLVLSGSTDPRFLLVFLWAPSVAVGHLGLGHGGSVRSEVRTKAVKSLESLPLDSC